MREIRFVGMMGKFSKVAQGVMMVHARSAPVDFGFLADLAAAAGAPAELRQRILRANTAGQVGEWMVQGGYGQFFQRLAFACCQAVLNYIDGGVSVSADLVTTTGVYLGGASIDA